MIPEAREVHLSRKDRKVLEASCRSPMTLQRDLKRARIVLLAADGRSTRSIAKEVGVQPRIVSLWRHRYADQGLEGLQDKPRPGKQPIYTKATDKQILKLLDKLPPEGFARWTGPLLAGALGDVDVQYVWRFLRSHKIDLAARKPWCESNDPNFTAKAADVVGLYVAPPAKAIVLCVDEKPSIQALERAQGYLKLPNGRALTGQSHDYKRHGTTTLFAALEVATGKIIAAHSKRRRRVEFLGFYEQPGCRLSGSRASRHSRQSQHPQQERALAQETPQGPFPFHPNSSIVAQSDRNMVFGPSGPVTKRRLLHGPRAVAGTHRCFHRRLQRNCRAIRLDQEKSLSAAVQKSPYHSTLIPGTSTTVYPYSVRSAKSSDPHFAACSPHGAKAKCGIASLCGPAAPDFAPLHPAYNRPHF